LPRPRDQRGRRVAGLDSVGVETILDEATDRLPAPRGGLLQGPMTLRCERSRDAGHKQPFWHQYTKAPHSIGRSTPRLSALLTLLLPRGAGEELERRQRFAAE